jgi:hypothetical protein
MGHGLRTARYGGDGSANALSLRSNSAASGAVAGRPARRSLPTVARLTIPLCTASRSQSRSLSRHALSFAMAISSALGQTAVADPSDGVYSVARMRQSVGMIAVFGLTPSP